MDIFDKNASEKDMDKYEACRLLVTQNTATGERFFDWAVKSAEIDLLHKSLRILRRDQLPEEQQDKLEDLLPPLVVAVDKKTGDRILCFAHREEDGSEENVAKVEEMKKRILVEHSKFLNTFLMRGKTSSFDDVTTPEERKAALYDSVSDEELFKMPRNAKEAEMKRTILQIRIKNSSGFERAQYKHFLENCY